MLKLNDIQEEAVTLPNWCECAQSSYPPLHQSIFKLHIKLTPTTPTMKIFLIELADRARGMVLVGGQHKHNFVAKITLCWQFYVSRTGHKLWQCGDDGDDEDFLIELADRAGGWCWWGAGQGPRQLPYRADSNTLMIHHLYVSSLIRVF